jgi:hypothetical protein
MKSALILSYICGAAIVGSSVAALALATVTTTARTQIQDSGGIQVVQGLNLAAQVGSGALAQAGISAISGTVGSGVASNLSSNSVARVMLTGNAGDAVSLAVSPTLDATRTASQQKLVVQTFGGTTASTVLGGELRANGALSVDVGGRVALAGRSVSPGAYQGLLMVIAQYN